MNYGPNRRYSSGRLVCNIDGQDDNIWAGQSELGVCGRPLSDDPVVLPLSRDIILPESLSADGDLKQAERQRPSNETCSAQKGMKRWQKLLQSMLTMTTPGCKLIKNKPVCVLNLTGYIEDVGCAVLCMQWGDPKRRVEFKPKLCFAKPLSKNLKVGLQQGGLKLGLQLNHQMVETYNNMIFTTVWSKLPHAAASVWIWLSTLFEDFE